MDIKLEVATVSLQKGKQDSNSKKTKLGSNLDRVALGYAGHLDIRDCERFKFKKKI